MNRVDRQLRPAFLADMGPDKRRRRFHTEAAAYYAIAKAWLGAKYLAAAREVEGRLVDEVVASVDPRTIARARRAVMLFHDQGDGILESDGWSPKLWQAYVRRVAVKLRAMDRRRNTPELPPSPPVVDDRDVDHVAAALHVLAADVERAFARANELWRQPVTDAQRVQLKRARRALRRAASQ